LYAFTGSIVLHRQSNFLTKNFKIMKTKRTCAMPLYIAIKKIFERRKKLVSVLCLAILTCYAINIKAQNTKLGINALASNTTGTHNTALGYQSMLKNTTGGYNTASGSNSLYSNISGNENTAHGYSSLYNNTTGYKNTATGYQSLYSNTTGYWNSAHGDQSLYFNTTGASNTANGYQSLYSNTTGSFNTASGHASLHSNTTGEYNTGIGYAALLANTTGSFNTALGRSALAFSINGGYNVATGNASLAYNTSGSYNTASGFAALYSNAAGLSNTAIGYFSLYYNTGSSNTAIGYQSLITNTTGSLNTALGYNANVAVGYLTNATAIGANAVVNASNKIRFGNGAVTIVEGNAPYTVSDGRFKKQVTEEVKGLSFINKLRPVVYTLEARKLDAFMMKSLPADKRENILKSLDYSQAEKMRRSGFIAQEVEKAAKESDYAFDGVHVPKDENDNYSLAYAEFVVPLVKAVQELTKQNENLQKQINELKAVKTTSVQTDISSQSSAKIMFTNASLEQNIPNPLRNTTGIRYYIPAGSKNAQLTITDNSGKPVKQITLNTGTGVVNIDASALSNGAYNYSLVIDGKRTESKTMVVAH
jgi:hypothetical protein